MKPRVGFVMDHPVATLVCEFAQTVSPVVLSHSRGSGHFGAASFRARLQKWAVLDMP
jgi:hypothetical protein